ncbi:protein DA1-related 2-like isoform X2 [Telopea speciosissima]|uniref:protein DA1-related 2-like isoform X2 n=1 Tax=Telopea speciosissima TaxID=54955 RepID=UPI001CC64326|nr:protein DA1-related 2-like isoform X2 [Telopea speciosissima]
MASSGVNHFNKRSVYDTERKSRFMKWIGKIFKIGSGRGETIGHRPQFLGDENMVSRAPARSTDDRSRTENDELDHPIALSSLAEDLKKPNGYKSRTDNDEELPRSLKETLNMAGYPPYPPQYFPGGYRFCGGCNRQIGCGNYLGSMGAFWHPECFRCHACHRPITEHEFTLSGRNPYHKSCFKELHHPKCEVCHQYSWNARYISLGDGRTLCFECMESAIMDTGDCQPLYHAIRDYYEGMNMKIDQQIPMLLVERQALNEAIEGEKNGYHHMPETRGLCLSEEQTVSGIHQRPRIGGNRLIGMKKYSQKLTRKCEVTAILVLYGLPRLLTGSILAHELMHGWLRLKGYCNLNPEVEEGICQVLSHMWLESEVLPGLRSMPSTSTASSSSSSSSSKKGRKSDVENKLGEFFMHQIAQDISTAYGEGFRAANAAVNRYGLRRTLDHIRLTGNVPL